MRSPRTNRSRSSCIVQALKILALPVFVYLFRNELFLIRDLIRFVIAEDRAAIALPDQQVWSMHLIVLLAGLFIVLAAAFILLYGIAGIIYPITLGRDQWNMAERLIGFFFGSRKPVLWVREGRLRLDAPTHNDYSGGVALVDPTSAIVLEDGRKNAQRVRSAGTTFIGSSEKFVGAVSLRRQSRSLPETKVLTSDGIELTTTVTTMFTLGEEPDVVKVAYVRDPYAGGDWLSEDDDDRQKHLHLRVVKIDWDGSGGGKIRAIDDDLDLEDKAEIHSFARRYQARMAPRVTTLAPDSDSRKYPPYFLDDQRIRAAARAAARRTQDDAVEQWSDYPVVVAAATLRDLIASIRYDDLYLPQEFDVFNSIRQNPDEFPLVERIRPTFANAVRRLGVLSYQFIFPISGQEIEPGMRVDRTSFRIAPVQPLTSPKVLRNLGIKVVSAGFGDLTPSPEMQQQRLNHWAMRWHTDVTENERARRLAHAAQIKSNAKAQRYNALISNMLTTLSESSSNDLVLTKIYQTLGEIAKDTSTRGKLPEETVALIEKFQTMLPPPKRTDDDEDA